MKKQKTEANTHGSISLVGAQQSAPALARIERREILKLAGAVLAAGVPCLPAHAQAKRPKKIVIAGGGIGGLCCAYELKKRGHEVTVLEASGRAGGHVKTLHDPFADGLYADAGAEHFTKPGYDRYWQYVDEFKLTALPYPRRDRMVRRIRGKMYTEEMLADRNLLNNFGFNNRETDYLARHPWWGLASLYFAPYVDSFGHEYQPFQAGLDNLDQITLNELLRKDGASATAIQFIGNNHASALHIIWHAAILKLRGVPLFPPKVYRVKGGNQLMTDAFAARLGERVRLGCPVTGVKHGETGVTVQYRHHDQEKEIDADYLVSGMSLVMLRRIPVAPVWPEAKDFVIKNMPYNMMTRVVFQARSPFWQKEGLSPNMDFGEENLHDIWRMAEDVETERGILMGNAGPTTTADQALATFRQVYPGKLAEIDQALVIDWSQDTWAKACETMHYAPGWLKKVWPNVIEPHGRIHFVGAYADNLNWGMEAATRSANRVAEAIDNG